MLNYAIIVKKAQERFMELLQLRYFCDAAKSENFSKTAKKFCVPPSNISQSIRRLEDELEVKLFTRKANKIALNELGLEFYNRVSLAVSLIDEAKSVALDDVNQGRIKICINSNRRIVMKAIEKFKKRYPDVEIHTVHFASVGEEDFDLIIAGDEEEYRAYHREKLISEGVAVAIRKDNPLASLEKFDLGTCVGASFIAMTEKSSLLGLTKKICRDFGFEPRVTIQSDDPFYVRKCVELGLGIAIVPSFSWQGQFSDDVRLHVLSGYSRDTYMYLNPSKYATRALREFCVTLTEECAQEK